MIEFKRNANKVEVHVRTSIPLNACVYLLRWECQDEHYAYLLRDRMETDFSNAIRKIREEEYNKGWKDAKAKRAKQTWFSGLFK